jgi:hypothetical protein
VAALPAEIQVDINDVCDTGRVIGTVKLTGVRRFNLRLSACLLLIRLAAWVAPVGIDIEDARD